VKRLVLLGGGHAHLNVLRDFALRPDEKVSVTLVSPVPIAYYSGMIPGWFAGHYALEECGIDLLTLAGRAHAAFANSAAVLVNPGMRDVILANSQVIPYDVLSIDIGLQPMIGGAKGVSEHAFVVRPFERAIEAWERVRSEALSGRMKSITMVGGGAAGVELALAMEYRLRAQVGGDAPHVRILTDGPVLVPDRSEGVRVRLARILRNRNIGAHVSSAVSEVGPDFVRTASGIQFASDATFWTAGGAAPALIRDSGFRMDRDGYLAVNDFMQSVSHPEVFGVGDCATNTNNARPKAGVFAVRAGPTLASNLRAALAEDLLSTHASSARYLSLISAGDRRAVGSWGPLSWQGKWVWRWKDRIDRRFVALYKEPPRPAA
jgi:pyridine nucleotide-disulfide oxidoreductase family protein